MRSKKKVRRNETETETDRETESAKHGGREKVGEDKRGGELYNKDKATQWEGSQFEHGAERSDRHWDGARQSCLSVLELFHCG